MTLRIEIATTRESILRRVEQAASKGAAREVMHNSRLLEATEELLSSYDALAERYKMIKKQAEGGLVDGIASITTTRSGPDTLPQGLTAKAKGEQRRQAFLADARAQGIGMERIKGVRYRSPKQQCVGVASASETEEYRDRWFLGLAPDTYDGFVLLCEDRTGFVHRFIASSKFANGVMSGLSRDNAGQIKFHITREHGSFYLDVPGREHIAIDGLRENFANLCDGSDSNDHGQPFEESTPVLPTVKTDGLHQVKNSSPRGGHRDLGRRGNDNLEDYLLPVIKLMMYDGKGYRDAFKQVTKRLDVRYNTVSAQCTRALGLNTSEFCRLVANHQIFQVLKSKFPDRRHLIDAELGA
jgi:hypothetical protein